MALAKKPTEKHRKRRYSKWPFDDGDSLMGTR